MSKETVAFITCVNHEKTYQKSLRFLKRLVIPDAISVEYIAIYGASSLTAGYNIGASITKAKYKVYLHQDVYILEKDFMSHMVKLFESNENVGLMGVIGARTLPLDGIWWKTYNGTGKVYDSHKGYIDIIDYKRDKRPYDSVIAVDGLIMMTQYDLPWREDLFDGWHFYDLSQCFEFRLSGYDIIVPYQEMPWCVHDCGVVSMTGYDLYREIFLKHYMKPGLL